MEFSRGMKAAVSAGLILLFAAQARAQVGADAAARRLALERLSVVGSVLYIAAHPDDENTAMLAWLGRERHVRVANLSLTRGDGGQNLIGTEQGELLGLVRTEETLAARRIDGAEQLFTRAVDFGYSKTPEETLRIWGHDAVLADIVWIIRSFRPDVVVSRFPANGDGGHGHHTASAILAVEAFAAAGDPARFPEQLTLVKPWQAKRIVWNAWRRPGEPVPAGEPPRLTIDFGGWDSLTGLSYPEIAAASRSMHKSQGFGSSSRRGPLPNDFVLIAGEPMQADILDGVELSWKRIANSDAVAAAIARVQEMYKDEDPAAAVPLLIEVLNALDKLPDDPIVARKKADVISLIRACAGLWMEVTTPEASAIQGSSVKLTASLCNRSKLPIVLTRIDWPSGVPAWSGEKELAFNQVVTNEQSITVPRDAALSQPYWLMNGNGGGVYTVPEQALVGVPRNPSALLANLAVKVAGREMVVNLPVTYRFTDAVDGERIREVVVAPRAAVSLAAPVLYFPDKMSREVTVRVRANEAKLVTSVSLEVPTGWQVAPANAPLSFATKGEEKTAVFTVKGPEKTGSGKLIAYLHSDRDEKGRALLTIEHPHISPITLFPVASAKVVRVDIARPVKKIGYIMGPGDGIPDTLRQLGFDVALLSDEELMQANFQGYEAIIVGVRAYNTRDRLAQAQSRLLEYVNAGGTLIVQYNTERGLVTDRLAPYPLTIGHDRVTDENAAVTLLAPTNSLLTKPHRIDAKDFEGWVQERGLYFASKWDEHFTPLLAMNDPGEQPLQGSLLVARSGKGTYVFTGLAFFRELPAGVPGAARLFVNLLAAGKNRD